MSLAGLVTALLLCNARLGSAALAVMPIAAAATAVFRVMSRRVYSDSRDKEAAVNANLHENISGLRVVQAYRREQRNFKHFALLSDAYRRSRMRAQSYIAVYFPLIQSLPIVSGALVLLVAAGKVRDGTLTGGALIAVLLYIDMLFAPVQQIAQAFDGYQQASVALRRIGGLLSTPSSIPSACRALPAARGPARIEMRHVHFSYQPENRPTLKDLDFAVEPGETIALVGSTGAGKSTIVKLIARFYDVTSGSVLIDGTDIREYDLASYRRRIGLVTQEPYLFAGTVGRTIAYGRPTATDDEIEAAAMKVGAWEAISRLPGGFGYVVTEGGGNLSAGQRQLIALARAALADPDILLLDEATANLDLPTEKLVTEATGRLAAGRTTVIVAHRLTTAARADRIMVIDSGRVIESGDHHDLRAAGGTYSSLWSAFTGARQDL